MLERHPGRHYGHSSNQLAGSHLCGDYSLVHIEQIASGQDDCYVMIIVTSCSSMEGLGFRNGRLRLNLVPFHLSDSLIHDQ